MAITCLIVYKQWLVISNVDGSILVHVMEKLESVIDHCDSYLKNVKHVVHCSRTNLLTTEVHKGRYIQKEVDSLSQKS